jgi:lipopolysaccharide transport system ATP-binding protein
LVPGSYSLNVACFVSGVIADWVLDAAAVEVAEGDFFGTGKMPPPNHGHVMFDHAWRVE